MYGYLSVIRHLDNHSFQADFESHLASLQMHLTTLEHLSLTYTAYQHSYNNLLVEMDRRRRYRDQTQQILDTFAAQLEAGRNGNFLQFFVCHTILIGTVTDELQSRQLFIERHRAQLPDDLCLSIENIPSRYEISLGQGEVFEDIPSVDADLLQAVG